MIKYNKQTYYRSRVFTQHYTKYIYYIFKAAINVN